LTKTDKGHATQIHPIQAHSLSTTTLILTPPTFHLAILKEPRAQETCSYLLAPAQCPVVMHEYGHGAWDESDDLGG
jgi:hypothetical protein